MVSFSYTGGTIGALICYPICGAILDRYDWELVFYVTGAMGLACFLVWTLLVKDDPSSHPLLSATEKDYILANRSPKRVWHRPPYLEIMTNPTVMTLMFVDFATFFCTNIIITQGPTFLDEIFNFDIKQV